HGLGDKRAAYEESIRIPLLVRYPKRVKAGALLDAPVLNVDLTPTLLELAGAPPLARSHGRSFAALLGGSRASWRSSFLTEYFAEPQFPRIPSWQAVRGDRWKYIHYTERDGMDELYDLKADPGELQNQIADPAAAGALRAMKEELERLLKASG